VVAYGYITHSGVYMADTNKVWLSGVAVAKPILSKLPGQGLPYSWFNLLVREDFKSKGQPSFAHSLVRVEALGKQADPVFSKVLEGLRYRVDGYLKIDETGGFSVRAFAVNLDESDEAMAYAEGLRSALGILMKSADIKSAAEAIRFLLQSRERG
jgi:hypothetical protein